MSNLTKIVTGIVVVFIIIAGILWYSSGSGTQSNETVATNSSDNVQAPSNQDSQTAPVAQPTQSNSSAVASTGNSTDAAINQDTVSIDSQLKNLDSDNAN